MTVFTDLLQLAPRDRVLVVTNDFPPRVGGIQTFVRQLVGELPPAQVVVHASAHPDASSYDAEQPFTIVTDIAALPRGDVINGLALYAQACSTCHGSMHDGRGRLSERVPILPEDTINEPTHADFTPRVMRLVFTEKIRHGLFLGYSGVMPPFSAETLSDGEVSDVLEALGVLGE